MWTCPICTWHEKQRHICKRCGFDESKDFYGYRTVMIVGEREESGRECRDGRAKTGNRSEKKYEMKVDIEEQLETALLEYQLETALLEYLPKKDEIFKTEDSEDEALMDAWGNYILMDSSKKIEVLIPKRGNGYEMSDDSNRILLSFTKNIFNGYKDITYKIQQLSKDKTIEKIRDDVGEWLKGIGRIERQKHISVLSELKTAEISENIVEYRYCIVVYSDHVGWEECTGYAWAVSPDGSYVLWVKYIIYIHSSKWEKINEKMIQEAFANIVLK